MNFELKTKEILLDTFILTAKIEDNNLINNLIKFIKYNKDNNLSYKTNVKGHFTGFESLIKNIDFLNFIKMIQNHIFKIYDKNFMIKEAWGNICKIGEEVLEHSHKDVSGFCGILYLSGNGSGTYFKEYDLLINEEIGKFVLFHPLLSHSVSKIEKNIERITIAFNAFEIKSWEDYSKINWINKNEI
jgi:hypothetical protein